MIIFVIMFERRDYWSVVPVSYGLSADRHRCCADWVIGGSAQPEDENWPIRRMVAGPGNVRRPGDSAPDLSRYPRPEPGGLRKERFFPGDFPLQNIFLRFLPKRKVAKGETIPKKQRPGYGKLSPSIRSSSILLLGHMVSLLAARFLSNSERRLVSSSMRPNVCRPSPFFWYSSLFAGRSKFSGTAGWILFTAGLSPNRLYLFSIPRASHIMLIRSLRRFLDASKMLRSMSAKSFPIVVLSTWKNRVAAPVNPGHLKTEVPVPGAGSRVAGNWPGWSTAKVRRPSPGSSCKLEERGDICPRSRYR